MNTALEPVRPGHERRDVDVISLLIILLILILSCLIVFLVVGGMMHSLSRKTGEAAVDLPAAGTQQFPLPRLEAKPGASLSDLRSAEEADLNSYGWVDQKAGIVRIPITRAMQLILERGLPEVGAGQTPLSLMQARPSESATPPRLPQKP